MLIYQAADRTEHACTECGSPAELIVELGRLHGGPTRVLPICLPCVNTLGVQARRPLPAEARFLQVLR